MCLLSQKQFKRARTILEDLLADSPSDSIYENLAAISMQEGDYAQTLDYLKMASQLTAAGHSAREFAEQKVKN